MTANLFETANKKATTSGTGLAMRYLTIIGIIALAAITQSNAQAAGALEKVYGETVYVPAYSRIFSYPTRSELLAATLAVHNIDPETSLTLQRVDYHNEDGQLIRSLLEQPVDLAPLQSRTVLIPINDTTGGVGANFIIEWTSEKAAISPIAESIMTGPPGTPGPSFSSRGRVIQQQTAAQ
ncbi:MAG: DUF3124 domain-containing protein [Roseibium sp.]